MSTLIWKGKDRHGLYYDSKKTGHRNEIMWLKVATRGKKSNIAMKPGVAMMNATTAFQS